MKHQDELNLNFSYKWMVIDFLVFNTIIEIFLTGEGSEARPEIFDCASGFWSCSDKLLMLPIYINQHWHIMSFVDVPRMLEHKRNVIYVVILIRFYLSALFLYSQKLKIDYLFVNGHSYHIFKLIVYN